MRGLKTLTPSLKSWPRTQMTCTNQSSASMSSSDVFNPKSLSPSTFPPWLLVSAQQQKPTPPPSEMDRLRDLATRTRRVDYHFRIPKSLSTTSLMHHKSTDPGGGSDDARSTVSSTSATASLEHQNLLPTEFGTNMPSPNSAPAPVSSLPSSDTNPTPVQPQTHEAVLVTGNKKTSSANKEKDKEQPKMKANKQVQASLDGDEPFAADCEAYQKLFDQILTNIAQDDVIANSGLNLYHRVNECARDYMEAKQIVEQRENEIAAVSAKIEAMQAIMDEASKHLQKAKAIATEAIDSSVAEQFRLKEEQNLTNILIDMTNTIAKGNCHTWPRQKVNKHLEDLQSVFYKNKHHCQSPMVSSGIVYVAKHFIFHADYDDAFEPMLFHLANQTDYKAFVGRSRKNDHEFAKQHQGVFTNRPGLTPKTSTTAAPLGDEAPVDEVSDGAAGAAQAEYHDSEQAPSQKLTSLPPRSSSLPSSGHTYKHFDFNPDADMNKVADKIRSQLESQPGLTSGTMKAAVLESIAGLEVIFKDGTDGAPPNVRKDATAVFENIERLNKDFVKSDQVTRKLAETQGFRSIQTHELPGGRIQIDVTAAGCYEGCGCRTAKRDHLETSAVHGNSATLHEDMTASSGNSDQLWKNHHVSGPAPGNS